MESYKEYAIRCKTCNEPIAYLAPTYEELLASGVSTEEALNFIGLTEWCSRIAMLTPTIVTFNMENRQVIEGFKTVDAVDGPDNYYENPSSPVFTQCSVNRINPLVPPNVQITIPLPTRVTPNIPVPQKPVGPQPQVQPIIQGVIQQIAPRQQPTPRQQVPKQILQPIIQPIVQINPEPILPDIQFNKENLGEAIPVVAPQVGEFIEPTLVGVPTINIDATLVQPLIYIGNNQKTRILNGRTFLAR